MTTTTADKGEQECREAFEKWVLESWDATHLRTDRVGTYVCLHIFLRWQAWQACWNRRHTNEGQDVLPLTESKTKTIISKGYKITGYVLTHDDGRKAISDMQAVRWLEQDQFWKIMHPAPAGEGAAR